MLIKRLINEKSWKIIFAGFISYYFGLMVLQYNFKVFALLGLIVFIILFLTRIEYAFYFLLASRSLIDMFYGAEAVEGTRISHLIGVLLAFLVLYYIIVISQRNIFSLNINKIYVIFLIFAFPSVFFTESLKDGLGWWFRLIQGFLILNMTVLVVLAKGSELYKKRVNIICWVVIIAIFIPYSSFFKNYIQGSGVEVSKYVRYGIIGVSHNVFSYLLFIVFPFCLFLYSNTARNSKKILWLIFIVIIALTVYITYTRNIWIGFTTILVAWNIFRKKFMIFFSIIGIIILLIIFNPAVQDRLEDIYIVLTSKSFFEVDPLLGSARVGTWQAHIGYFLDHSTLIEKLFGNGYQIYLKIKIPPYNLFNPSHNNYLTLLMSTGIFGLSFYLLYILKLFQESFTLLRRTKEIYLRNIAQVFISLLLAYVIISMQTHILWFISIQYYFSVFAGFVIAANILEENEIKGSGIIVGEPKK